jgi:hypothetical protein
MLSAALPLKNHCTQAGASEAFACAGNASVQTQVLANLIDSLLKQKGHNMAPKSHGSLVSAKEIDSIELYTLLERWDGGFLSLHDGLPRPAPVPIAGHLVP